MIFIKGDFDDKRKKCLKCGRFLFSKEGDKIEFSQKAKVTTNLKEIQIKCKCGEITRIFIK